MKLILVASLLFGVVVSLTTFRSFWPDSKETEDSDVNSLSGNYFENKLAFNGADGRPKLYDFATSKEYDLGVDGYVYPFLWSPDGKYLATLVQGEYGGKSSFSLIPEAKATTAGFNYLLYVIDLETYQSELLIAEVFGDVFWSKDSLGLYFNEKYQNNNPILIGEQAGLMPDRVDYFYADLEGNRKSATKTDFYRSSIYFDPTVKYSPNRNYFIKSFSNLGEKVVSTNESKEHLLRVGVGNAYLRDSQWSPSGENIAFIYKEGEFYDTENLFGLAVVSLDEVLSDEILVPKALNIQAQNLYFSWIDESNILINQVNGYLDAKGTTSIYNLETGNLMQIAPEYSPKLSGPSDFLISPDKKLFMFQDKAELVISSFPSDQLIRLKGDMPSWFDPPDIFEQTIREVLENSLVHGAFLRDFKKLDKDKYIVVYLEQEYRLGDPNYKNISCPTQILGQAMIGDYHAALVEDGKIISDVNVPNLANFESEDKLALVYVNYDYEDYRDATKNKLKVEELIDLKDYTGDGNANEFILTTTSGGCGFYENLVVGYDVSTDSVRLYSDWIGRFDPVAGRAYDLFECGDHGSDTRVEKWWEFNEDIEKFILVNEKITEC